MVTALFGTGNQLAVLSSPAVHTVALACFKDPMAFAITNLLGTARASPTLLAHTFAGHAFAVQALSFGTVLTEEARLAHALALNTRPLAGAHFWAHGNRTVAA